VYAPELNPVDALEGELDDHLGYARHDPESHDGGNSRNWHRGQDRAHQGQAGGDFGAAGPGFLSALDRLLRVGAISMSCAQVAALRGVAGEPACK
jgi:hypothetical protein